MSGTVRTTIEQTGERLTLAELRRFVEATKDAPGTAAKAPFRPSGSGRSMTPGTTVSIVDGRFAIEATVTDRHPDTRRRGAATGDGYRRGYLVAAGRVVSELWVDDVDVKGGAA